MTARTQLRLLSGGAAQALVKALAAPFGTETGCQVEGTFGAVGAMKDALLGGAPADLLILTAQGIAELTQAGHVVAGSAVDIGAVPTGVAVRSGAAAPPIGDGASLAAALRGADSIYFPDPTRATAGIHFARVLEALGLRGELAPRLRPYPNGHAAMGAMAALRGGHPIGCTQARSRDLAERFAALLSGKSTREVRESLGFSPL